MDAQTGTFVMLGLAIAAVWLPHGAAPLLLSGRVRIAAWQLCLFPCLAAGLASGIIQPAGVAVLALMWAAGTWHAGVPGKPWPALVFGAVTLAAACHALPGFRNLLLADAVMLRPDALPFTLYANADKGLAGLLLLVFAARPMDLAAPLGMAAARAGLPLWRAVSVHALVTGGIVLGLAWLMGVVRFDPLWRQDPPHWQLAWRFLLVNLLFTCAAEEAFFRGLVQGGLTRWLACKGRPAWPAILVAALLFGLAHAGGGMAYALLAAVAGLGYGLVRERTGRVGAAVAVHFALNAAHFLFFSYPRLA